MTDPAPDLRLALKPMPLIAILRGLRPDDAATVGTLLIESGFVALEVPLNSPAPYETIRVLVDRFGDQALIGAGTVMTTAQVESVAELGARLLVMPHSDPNLIKVAKESKLLCVPGVATPNEGFAALSAGADALKLFPAEALTPTVVKAWRAVFPKKVWLLPVGGISPDRIEPYIRAGANGFGVGSALFRPGLSAATLSANAARFTSTIRSLCRAKGERS